MTIATAQSVSGGPWGSGAAAGAITALGQLGPQQKVAPFGSTVIVTGINLSYANPINTSGISDVTAGFDPSIVSQLSVKLRSTGQVWPCGYS